MLGLGAAKEQLQTAPSSALVPKPRTRLAQVSPSQLLLRPGAALAVWGGHSPSALLRSGFFPDFLPLCFAGGCGRAVLNSPDTTQGCLVFISAFFSAQTPSLIDGLDSNVNQVYLEPQTSLFWVETPQSPQNPWFTVFKPGNCLFFLLVFPSFCTDPGLRGWLSPAACKDQHPPHIWSTAGRVTKVWGTILGCP